MHKQMIIGNGSKVASEMSSGLARRALWVLGLATLIILFATTSSAADDEAWAVFDGKKDRTVEIRTTSGRVFVTGTNSDTVYVRARRTDLEEIDEEPESDDPRAAGLRKITHSATGLEVWGDENVVTVTTGGHSGTVDLHIRVPRNAALDIEAHFADSVLVRNIKAAVDIGTNGSARLENVDGEIEVETSRWIYLDDVAGSVVCNSGFGGIEGTVKRLDPDRPISLSAMGPIDVAIPRNSKATLYLKTSFGEVYTDFDVELQRREDWPDDTGASIPFVTVLPPRPPKMAAPVVIVEPRPVKAPRPDKPDKPDKSDKSDAAKKSGAAEKAEQEERTREAYDEAVRAYLRQHREELRLQRDELSELLREQSEVLREDLRSQYEVQRVLERELVDVRVGVAPLVVPTLTPGLIGEINGGGVEIRLTSMSGSIYVRRGK